MTNDSQQKETDRIDEFSEIGYKIKEMIRMSASNVELLNKMKPETLYNLNNLNGKSDDLITKVNRLQQYFALIARLSTEELNNSFADKQNSSNVNNSYLRINRLAAKAKRTIEELQLDAKEFTQSYKKIKKNKDVIPDIIRIMQEFIDKIFLIFEDLTDEAEEVYYRISKPYNKHRNNGITGFTFNQN